MASYWIIVRRDAPDLFALLRDCLRFSTVFRVTEDRRLAPRAVDRERRRVTSPCCTAEQTLIIEEVARPA